MRSLVSIACALCAVLVLRPAPARADYMDHFAVRNDVGPRKAPYLGRSKLLVIPVEVKGSAPIDLERVRHFFSPDDLQGFVHYFRTASLGRFEPEVTVAPVVHFDECPLPKEQFPTCTIARGDINAFSAGMDMMREVVRRADGLGVDFAAHDVNGRNGERDGWADGVMLLANVPFGGIAFPFAYFNRDDNLAGGNGGPLIVDGTKLGHFAIAGRMDVHVMVHEFGHLLGLTDLYDESGQYDGLHFSVMGAWGYDPKIPLPDAETRYRLRWGSVTQVTSSGRYRLSPAESSGELLRLGTGSEYFLVENRGPGGRFDGEFTARGLVVTHVDRTVKLSGEEGRFVDRILDCVNCDPWHPYIRIVEADGRFDLQRGGRPDYAQDLFREGDELGPDASGIPLSATHAVQSTNLYSGAQTGFAIREISVRDDGAIELTVEAPSAVGEADACAEPLCTGDLSGPGCVPVNCAREEEGPPFGDDEGCGGCASTSGSGGAWALAGLLALVARGGRRATAS